MSAHIHKIFDRKALKVSCSNCTLSELCLPHNLDQSEISQLEDAVDIKRPIQKGEHLYSAGDPFESLFAVRSGSFKTYLLTPEGDEQITGFNLPGDLLGLDGVDTGAHTVSAIALETTTVCELPYAQLDTLCSQISGLRLHMMRIASREISDDHNMLLLLGKMTAEERLASFLYSLSSRLKKRGYSATDFNLTMPRHDLAKYLGLAVETISRLFSRFQEDGLLRVNRRNIHIVDLQRLQTIITHTSCPKPS
ncbi:MAG TPA: transcriptional regulator FNR [Gammaproteobacteria bacterium]|nr:transcriptional regulator FNR [Gammaproteobacteria bacterium]